MRGNNGSHFRKAHYQAQYKDETWQNMDALNTQNTHNPVNYNYRGKRKHRKNQSFVQSNYADDSDNESISSNSSSNRGHEHDEYGVTYRSAHIAGNIPFHQRGGFPPSSNQSNYRGGRRGRPSQPQFPMQNPSQFDNSLFGQDSRGKKNAYFDANSSFQITNVPPPNNLPLNYNDKIDSVTNFKNYLRTINPSELIKKYRQDINKLEEACLSKHEKRFHKITMANDIASNKEKLVWKEHLNIIKLQQKTFEQCITSIKVQLTEIHCLPSSSVYNKCEEILDEVQQECRSFKKSLPVYAYKTDILSSLAKNQVTIISADACYSASEMIPLFVHQTYQDYNVLSCEPNAATAVSLAQASKLLTSSTMINLIGYKTENGGDITKDTKIMFTSVSKLYKESIKDSHLSIYNVIILHCNLRRNIEVDFLLECLRSCFVERPDFRAILLLSPLDDASKFVSYFSSVTVNAIMMPNIIFPVQTMWKNSPFSFDVDYVNQVIETALAIHTLNDEGDILVFLPTFSDVNKVSKILPLKFIEYNYHDVLCLPLCGNSLDESNINFMKYDSKKEVKRKIFLTTSWAELLSLKSVVYVVDTGIKKKIQYDQQKASDFLEQTFISRARAKLRKFCAGHYCPGICYRLYNKHDYLRNMPQHEVPEMLCKNPLEIIIKLFQYNPVKAMTVEFIENVPQEVKENTLAMLRTANAIKDGKLTTLGEQIVKLPFLPRYSKLIVIGIQWGFAFEVIIFVAFFLVNKHIFTYDADDKETQRKVEATKLKFMSFDSDTFTYLNIYKKWALNDFQESWCVDRALNFNVLVEVQAKIRDIIAFVNKNLKEEVSLDIKLEQDTLALQEILFDCFKDNLCVYTGHHRSGYYFLRAGCITFLHPSSSVLQKNNPPEFIVFDHLKVKSRSFMMSITSIPSNVVISAVKKGALNYDEAYLLKKKLEPDTIENVGIMLIKHVLLGKKGRKLMEVENEIKKETKCDLIVIEPSEEKGSITVFAPIDIVKKVKMILHNMLQTKLDIVLNEEETLILELKKGQISVPIHITWKKGATAMQIKPETHSTKPKTESDQHQPESEESAVKQCINLTWVRRFCKGFGFLSFSSKDFAVARRLSMTSVLVNGTEAEIQINKNFPNQLYISGLPSNTTNDDLKAAFDAILKEQFVGNVQIASAKVISHKPFVTTDEDLSRFQENIFNSVYDLFHVNDFTVSISKPENTATIMEACIHMNIPNILEQSAVILKDSLRIDDVPVKAEPVYYTSVICGVYVFKALKLKMDSQLKRLEQQLRLDPRFSSEDELFKFKVEACDSGFACFKLSTGRKEIMDVLQRLVNKWLEGQVITSSHFKKLHKLFTHGGHLWLRAIEDQEDVYIIDEYKSKSLRLYGLTEKCQDVVERIKKYLLNTEHEIVKRIDLSKGKHSRPLLKAVIRKYGIDLKDFIQEFKLRSAEVNIRAAQLVFHGDSDSIEKALAALENLASNCSPAVEEELLSFQEVCCTCAIPPIQSSIRLEHCAHLYCAECLKGLIANAKFPILCCAEDCEKELILEDIRRGLDYDENEINRLLNLSMTDFIVKNTEYFAYCPAPDCSMFFDKREVTGSKWRCKLCQNDICIQCNVVFHHGYTCDLYQGTKDDPNYSVKVWLTDMKANCKPCPKCKTGIEKTAGCNHMTCATCHTHFCWLCVTAFPDATTTYNHLPYCK